MRADRVLTEARTLLDGIDAELRNYEQTRHQRDEQALAQRERISQRKLDQQALVLSADTLQAAVEKAGFVLQDVLNALPEDARPKSDSVARPPVPADPAADRADDGGAGPAPSPTPG